MEGGGRWRVKREVDRVEVQGEEVEVGEMRGEGGDGGDGGEGTDRGEGEGREEGGEGR